jgi:glycosyltransferase involved in cell wall biosynthesis/O-antigen ligase
MGSRGERDHAADALAGKRLILDCRWLGMGGAGRVTEMLLREFRAQPPPGEWTYWGDERRIRPLAFKGVHITPGEHDPLAVMGQRDFFAVPSGDAIVYMHQVRPLRPGRSVTFIHDTIPLRYGGRRTARLAKRIFFLLVARLSARVLTVSEFSRRRLGADLRIPTEGIEVVRCPVDSVRAARIASLRRELRTTDTVLYVGRFGAHKNLHRLARAFAASHFAAQGGKLLLVGGWGREVDAMRTWLAREGIAAAEARPTCSDDELDRLFATSRALVLPSLEEGFGLPAFEAAACGLPVAASRTGALTELPEDVAVLFDPEDADQIREAIDTVTGWPPRVQVHPSNGSLGAPVLRALASCFAESRGHSGRTRSNAGRDFSSILALRRRLGGVSLSHVGLAALFLLFAVTPTFNPALLKAGDERLYLSIGLVLIAFVVAVPRLGGRRFRWIWIGLALGGLYVVVVGIVPGDFRVGVIGNAYRPLQPVLAFCACVGLLESRDDERWRRIFLVGGLIGCTLAFVHTLVPAIDPFSFVRPDVFVSTYGTLERESGAFVYPNNLGAYAAYLGIVALIGVAERRALAVNLYTITLLAALLAIFVSGSRTAAFGVFIGGAIVAWRVQQLRLPLVVTVVGTGAVLAGMALATGLLDEVVRSRIDVKGSFALRWDDWEESWNVFRDSPLIGGGIVPDTVDSSFFYLLQVGGLLGLALVGAMYWTTLFRPARQGDRATLPLLAAVLTMAIFQDAFGQPLANWAIGAGVFVLAAARTSERPVVEASSGDRPPGARDRPAEQIVNAPK